MASSSGNSPGSPPIRSSGSEGDFAQVIDPKKRKRMESNRESARRSRMRKQKHLDDLLAEVAQIKKENNLISSNINITTQHYLNVESENAVLRAQMLELSQRLHSLNEILSHINSYTAGPPAAWGCMFEAEEFQHLDLADNLLGNSSNSMALINQHPIMASAEIFDY
ncbi:Basic leucine-zipper 44 [Dorcoceras hygrometricum]|uniref:Basic leucine-zipper 44 n=1 Tax=Dorcoceras hygrometricum TaxID=472368 RepID=A0A2Z7AEW7_9LAMI|nr:Basic leucine-zipper 44 [Dorcoceras hygrometricum]